MKRLLVLCALCALFVGCSSDETTPNPTTGISINDAALKLKFEGDATSARVKFVAHEAWTATVEAADGWCDANPKRGTAGDIQMVVTAKPNTTGNDQTATITLKTETVTKVINVSRAAQGTINIPTQSYTAPIEGGEISVTVESNVDYRCMIPKEFQEWITPIETASAESRTMATKTHRFRIAAFVDGNRREGKIVFTDNQLRCEVTVIQGTYYESKDFSKDGTVVELQKATEGSGINIVLMGDAFSDRQITDGTYEKTMRKAMEAFFSEEPYTTYRNLFNVAYVNVVSRNEGYLEGGSTALSCWFGEGTEVGGNGNKVEKYAFKVPGMTNNKYYDTLVIIMMNKAVYAGTCNMDYQVPENDYGRGTSLAYFPIGTDDEMFRQLLIHEAGGHGFSKLADEYSYASQGRIPQKEIDDLQMLDRKYGWMKNVDVTSDPATIKWSTFLNDARYKNQVGIYEGGNTYTKGVWRPTDISIMVSNVGGFNAPSRQSIYYRIHKLAYGADWVYNYEDFVKYDEKNRTKSAQMKHQMEVRNIPHDFVPLHAPRIFRGDHR
ncbi:MAG: M64 family metallopeptidase [Alistipes sp.]